MNQEKIGEFIAKLRKEKNMTQEELGNILGVTGKAVSRWETGNGVPDISIVNNVSEVLEVTTTELLNGERVTSLKNKNLDEITENSIDFYKSKLIKKFKKVLVILLSIIFALTSILLLIFYVNNYNKYQLYRISSGTSKVSLSGILSINNDRNTLVISKLNYMDNNIGNIYNLEYELVVGGKSFYKIGNIDDFIYDSDYKLISFNSYIKTVNIYINEISKDILNEIINENEIFVNLRYIGEDKNIYNYSFSIRFEKEYSNSRLIYFN